MADLGSLLGSAGIGGAIGKAIVQLELDTKKYMAEMNAAQTQTVAGTSKMGSSFSAFGGLAKTALLGAGVAAVAFGAMAVKAAIEANAAHLKLQNTFANNASLSDSSVAAFEAQADALRDLTGVDDEAIVSAQALLGQFDLTGQQVQELIPLIVDLSAKMGIDLEAAAKAVGKATQGSTGILSRYGIVLDKDAVAADAFGATLKGLSVAQGFAADRADAEPWRVLQAQFEEVAEEVGGALLPVLQDLAQELIDAGPAIGTFVTALGEIKKVSPGLLDVLGKLGEMQEASKAALYEGLVPFVDEVVQLGREFERTFGPSLRKALSAFVDFGKIFPEAGKAITSFANLTEDELKDLQKDTENWVRAGIGDLDSYEEKWHGTSESAVRAMEGMAKQAKIMARDIKALDREGVPDRFILFLREQGPDAVHEFVTGTEKQKGRFLAAWKAYEKAVGDAVGNMKRIAKPGGAEVGQSLVAGLIEGIRSGTGPIADAVADLVRAGIAAGRKAAEAASPSKKMAELGQDMIAGLIQGLESDEDKVVRAAEHVIDQAIKAIERDVVEVERRLDKVLGKAADLRGSVAGGFGSFLDISGAFSQTDALGATTGPTADSIQAFFAQQLAGAKQFADVLKQLQAQGISSALLSQIAGAGPEALPFAQQLLQMGPGGIGGISDAFATIADLAESTAAGLSEEFFGERIGELRDELKGLREDLRQLNSKPQTLRLELRGDQALRQLILQVISELGLSRASL